MTPLESGIAACTPLTTPNTSAPSISTSNNFDPRERDWTRFIAVSFHSLVRDVRQSAAAEAAEGLPLQARGLRLPPPVVNHCTEVIERPWLPAAGGWRDGSSTASPG